MFKNFFIKKSIPDLLREANEAPNQLKRHLGPVQLIAMGIGGIVGAGIFVMTGQVAAQCAGPGLLLSFVFSALVCIFAALCYAEFASLIPISGSAYSYAYVTMGELMAWVIGWAIIAEFLFSAATVGVGWAGYFASFLSDLGVTFPSVFAKCPMEYNPAVGWVATGALCNLPAMLIVLLIGLLVSVGIKTAASVNNLLVILKLAIIVLFIVVGFAYMKAEHLTPFIPQNTGVFGEFGWSGVFRGASMIFFAYLGFDMLSTLGQEAKKPQRDLPVGMIGSLLLSAFIYILIGVALLGLVHYGKLDVADPLAVAVNGLGPKFLWLRFVVKLAILGGLISVILVYIVASARILMTMSNDGLLPRAFASVHPRFATPFFSTWVVVLACVVFAGFFPVGLLGQITAMGALLAFAIVCLGILILRYTQPHLERPFKTPFVPWVPLLGGLACLFQMFVMPAVTWVQLGIWMGVGALVYFGYGMRHSKVQKGAARVPAQES